MTVVKLNQKHGSKTFDNLFDEFFNSFPAGRGNGLKDNSFAFPPVNIHESKDAYHLELNVPGRTKEDFRINIGEGLLTVSFDKNEDNKTEDYKTIRREFDYQSFKRSFTLDEMIKADEIQAKYENGVLKLLLPKKEQAKNAAIQISIQ